MDFLELLLFGIASDELNSFLLHNLTAKGLKKLAHSIESSYTNIQKLVLKNLQTVCQVTGLMLHSGRSEVSHPTLYREAGVNSII